MPPRNFLNHPDRFYPVVDTVEWVARLAAWGVRTVQLRAKDLTHEQALPLVRAALKAVAGTQTDLVINDYWQAAIDCGAQHIHLGQEDLLTVDMAAIRRSGMTLGVSTHDDDELENALAHDPHHVALGPIYPTTLKSMRFAPQGLPRISEWKRRIGRMRLIAIGGITLERADGVYGAGADSIAVVSDVTQNWNPEARVRAWLNHAAVAA